MVLPSPVSVQLDEDDRTMIQPDVVICCDREKILQSHVYGAPDMVIEILSPSTRKKDMGLKLKKYITAKYNIQFPVSGKGHGRWDGPDFQIPL